VDEDELFKSQNGLTAAIEYLATESGRLRLEAVRVLRVWHARDEH
jgi:hypothetical protein